MNLAGESTRCTVSDFRGFVTWFGAHKSQEQLLRTRGRKCYEGDVGRSGDREIDSRWGSGDTCLDRSSLGGHPSFLTEASKSKELITSSCTTLLLGL